MATSTAVDNARVTLNVSGLKFETKPETLAKYPGTLLGDSEKRRVYYDKDDDEYFFDRNRPAFDAILYYFQSEGRLIRPENVPMDVFADEVRFYGLGDEELRKLQEEEGYFNEVEEPLLPDNELQRKIWQLFEYPDTSFAARIVAIISISVIIVSIITFCLETLPVFRLKWVCPLETPRNTTLYSSAACVQISVKDDKDKDKLKWVCPKSASLGNLTPDCIQVARDEDKAMPWFGIEAACIAWFTFEYIMRLIASPQKWVFIRSFLNLIDVIAIVPFYVTLPLPATSISSLSILRVLRLVRVFRIFKLSRHSRGLQILGLTLKASLRELCLLVFFLVIAVVLFSSAVYYAESSGSADSENFISIPHSFWWAIVTTTTVGYGDVVPITAIGKMVGSICAISGVLTIALPVPVIVSNFNYYYHREQDIQQAEVSRKEREKREKEAKANECDEECVSEDEEHDEKKRKANGTYVQVVGNKENGNNNYQLSPNPNEEIIAMLDTTLPPAEVVADGNDYYERRF